jgi:TonB family protein
MRCLGFPFVSAWTLHRSRSLEQVEVPMLQIRVNGAASPRIHVNGAASPRIRAIYALALALGIAGIASADSTEVAEIASANSVGVAGITSANSTEVAAIILSDDAMPQGPSVADRLAIIREKIQGELEYPPLARLHDSDGDALVRFEIDRSGNAENIRVVRSSGHDQLDTSAIHAVEAATPLPWVYGLLEVPVHFELISAR